MELQMLCTYSREQALEDGVLVDVSQLAREAGIIFPVAVTESVYENYVKVPEGVNGQDETGRLWDILWMLRTTITRARPSTDRLEFQLYVRNNNDYTKEPPLVTLVSVCGPGDDIEPVLTIMMPDED